MIEELNAVDSVLAAVPATISNALAMALPAVTLKLSKECLEPILDISAAIDGQSDCTPGENTLEQVKNIVDAISAVQTIASTVVSEAATTVVAEIITEAAAASSEPEAVDEQPLCDIISQHPVWIPAGRNPTASEIDEAIRRLDDLINALRNVDSQKAHIGASPGFETKYSVRRWCAHDACSVYETLPPVNGSYGQRGPTIPLPSPFMSIKYYESIKKAWIERKEYAENAHKREYCSCIKSWDHVASPVLAKLGNQCLEQAMVREASDCVTLRMQQPGCIKGEAWDRIYVPELCPTPASVDHLYMENTSIRIISGRNDMVKTIVSGALQAKHTIDLATCYLFPHDPVHRYILLDLLPYLARTRNVTVRLLCDMMPIESFLVRSPIMVKKDPNPAQPKVTKTRSGISSFSFLYELPCDAPPLSDRARSGASSTMEFIQQVIDAASSTADNKYQIRWWCARDSQDKYRVKNHAKCCVFDGGRTGGPSMALMGGSNIAPTVDSGNSDLDMVVGGNNVVNKIKESFDWLWDAMSDPLVGNVTEANNNYAEQAVVRIEHNEIQEKIKCSNELLEQQWTELNCRTALIRSEPSSAGSDVIFRHVLGAIATAEKTVDMCMGHSNKPMALALAMGEAVKRGVRCRLLVNSLFSCDIRVNQRDLFNSLKDLLTVAPGVEVWTTALQSHCRKCKHVEESDEGEEKKDENESESTGLDAPPFLHAKYTVIDGKWVAVGSWNVWSRSAFYEIEHELLIQSEKIATKLEEKFQKELEATSVVLTKPEDCDFYCPIGCQLCEPFGPFYA